MDGARLRHTPLVAMVFCAMLTFSACASGDGDATSGDAQQAGSSSSPSASPSDPQGPVGPAGPDDPDSGGGPVLSWVPLGPASPSDPPAQDWYRSLLNRDCAALRSGVENSPFPLGVWVAAASVCEAMESGRAEAWQQAAAEVEALGPIVADDSGAACFEVAVHEALHRALEFHDAHPSASAVATAPAPGTACPLKVEGLFHEDPSGQQGSCDSDWFLLTGRLLPSTTVTVDGSSEGLDVTVGAFDRIYLRLPTGPPGEAATVAAFDAAGNLIGEVEYRYPTSADECPPAVPPGDTGPPPDPAPEPSPEPAPTPEPGETSVPGSSGVPPGTAAASP